MIWREIISPTCPTSPIGRRNYFFPFANDSHLLTLNRVLLKYFIHVALMELDQGHNESEDLDDVRSNVTDRSNSSPLESVSVKKQPPPESGESIRVRSLVIASFWAIVIFLGLPTWWWTTSIYRARLPLQEMLEWADGKVCTTKSNSLHLDSH